MPFSVRVLILVHAFNCFDKMLFPFPFSLDYWNFRKIVKECFSRKVQLPSGLGLVPGYHPK